MSFEGLVRGITIYISIGSNYGYHVLRQFSFLWLRSVHRRHFVTFFKPDPLFLGVTVLENGVVSVSRPEPPSLLHSR